MNDLTFADMTAAKELAASQQLVLARHRPLSAPANSSAHATWMACCGPYIIRTAPSTGGTRPTMPKLQPRKCAPASMAFSTRRSEWPARHSARLSNKSKVANVLDALAAESQLPSTNRPPSWLDDDVHAEASEVLSCTNGLLHLPTRDLIPHSPAFFSLNALDFAYNPNAPDPANWLKFLDQLWPNDPASIGLLQEMFGLLLTPDTSHHKAFMLIGPPRTGKGTIARVLTRLLGGKPNICGPTLSSLSETFGLEPFIGKRLAIISDARLGGKTDHQVVVERLRTITGEDNLSINRKFKQAWIGQLETRVLVLTNETPKTSQLPVAPSSAGSSCSCSKKVSSAAKTTP